MQAGASQQRSAQPSQPKHSRSFVFFHLCSFVGDQSYRWLRGLLPLSRNPLAWYAGGWQEGGNSEGNQEWTENKKTSIWIE